MKIILSILFFSMLSAAQQPQKLNLEDVQIQGESQKNSINSLGRQKNTLEGRIPLRKNFREEILSDLPKNLENKIKLE